MLGPGKLGRVKNDQSESLACYLQALKVLEDIRSAERDVGKIIAMSILDGEGNSRGGRIDAEHRFRTCPRRLKAEASGIAKRIQNAAPGRQSSNRLTIVALVQVK